MVPLLMVKGSPQVSSVQNADVDDKQQFRQKLHLLLLLVDQHVARVRDWRKLCNDETEDYIYSPPLTKPPNEDAERFWLRIGHKLKDTDDDTCFKVIGVCSSDEYDELLLRY